MKEAIEKEGLKVHYMVQPLGFLTPDVGKQGFIDLPEFPFGMCFVLSVLINSSRDSLYIGLFIL